MASRVVYGLARQQVLPSRLGVVHAVTRTPILATILIVILAILLAISFPIDRLADWTSRVMLVIFAFVNVSLWLIKVRREPAPAGTFIVPPSIPLAGAVSCLAALLVDVLSEYARL
jgi:amino acid transporter